MSKLSAILLSSLILIQSINFSFDDVLQLDELIEHAQFHKQEYGDNFVVFLSKHYGELKAEHNEKHQEEQKDHEKLPFQCQSHVLTTTAYVLLDNEHDTEVELSDSSESNFHYISSHSSLHKKGLLQPPKHS